MPAPITTTLALAGRSLTLFTLLGTTNDGARNVPGRNRGCAGPFSRPQAL
jgi:hypothetical protein